MSEWSNYLAFGTSKKAIIAANWKCNCTTSEVDTIVQTLNSSGPFPLESEVVVACPSIHLKKCQGSFRNDVNVASQDVGINGMGAYTGELSAEMLVDSGVTWCLTGHSERRVGFGFPGETSDVVADKTKRAIDKGMKVIVCIGEKLEERESGNTMNVCSSQLEPVVAKLAENDWRNVVIAYEPVWAIGTGKTATPGMAEETHAAIRKWIAEKVNNYVARSVRIVYGGPAKKANCHALIQMPNIDGFLVGGASLKPEFYDIICCTPGNIEMMDIKQ